MWADPRRCINACEQPGHPTRVAEPVSPPPGQYPFAIGPAGDVASLPHPLKVGQPRIRHRNDRSAEALQTAGMARLKSVPHFQSSRTRSGRQRPEKRSRMAVMFPRRRPG